MGVWLWLEWKDYFLTDFFVDFGSEDLGTVRICDRAVLNRSNGVCVVLGVLVGCCAIRLDIDCTLALLLRVEGPPCGVS